MTDIPEDIKLDEKLKEDIQESKKYKVVMLNDDKTAEWASILIEIFQTR